MRGGENERRLESYEIQKEVPQAKHFFFLSTLSVKLALGCHDWVFSEE